MIRACVLYWSDFSFLSITNENHESFADYFQQTQQAKAIFYLWDAATRDCAESQKAGSILVMEGYCWEDGIVGSTKFPKDDLELIQKIVMSVPSRIVAIHGCWPDAPVFKFLAKVLALAISSTERLRLRFQVGDPMAMRYILKSHGIPVDLLARTESGTIKLGNHIAWMKTRKRLERRQLVQNLQQRSNGGLSKGIVTKNANLEPVWHGVPKRGNNSNQEDEPVIVECPLMTDIAFRQGTPYWHNSGNNVFRDMILEYLGRKHQSLDKSNSSSSSAIEDVRNIVLSEDDKSDRHIEFRDWIILEILESWNGRFLEWDKDLKAFCVMTDIRRIRSKVSVSIYNYRKVAGLRRVPSMERTPSASATASPGSNDGHKTNTNGKRDAIDDPTCLSPEGHASSCVSPCTTPTNWFCESETSSLAVDHEKKSRKRLRLDTVNNKLACNTDNELILPKLRGV